MTLELTVEVYAKEGNERFRYQGGRELELPNATDAEIITFVRTGIEMATQWAEKIRKSKPIDPW